MFKADSPGTLLLLICKLGFVPASQRTGISRLPTSNQLPLCCIHHQLAFCNVLIYSVFEQYTQD
jgi:hypothetical protein